MRSTGASRNASNPPCSRSATNSRLMASTAANSSVTHSTPAARSPSSDRASSPKWNSTKVETQNSSIAGSDSRVRSSIRRSLRISAPTTASVGVTRTAPAPSPRRPRARGREQRLAPAAQAEHEVGLGEPVLDVVRDQHARRAAARADQRLDRAGGARVEVGERLVEQQQLGLVQDRAADRHALGHAARQRAHRLVAAPRHPDRVEQRLDPRRRHAVQPRVEAQVLPRGEVAVEQRVVRQQPDAPAHRPALARAARARAPAPSPACGREQRGEDPQQRRLAGPVGAEHGERRSARQRRASRRPAPRARRTRGRVRRVRGPAPQLGAWCDESPRSVRTTCSSVGASTPKTSSIAFGEPGKFTISVWPRDPGDAPGEDPHRRVLGGLPAQRLGEARRLAVDHRARRLGRDVVRRQAGPARGEHEVAARSRRGG